MTSLGQRALAYGLVGLFCVPGPLGLAFALDSTVHRAAFIHSALLTDGTVIEMRPVQTTKTGAGTCIPVFRFAANDGRLHIIVSDISVPFSTFKNGEQVRVLYLPSDPEIARIDSSSTLWQGSLVAAIWGGVWSIIPVFVLLRWRRLRQAPPIQPA